MPKFNLTAHVTVTCWTVVEAATPEEAMKIAEDRNVVIGGMNSGEDETESWIVDDADGEAEGARVDE